MGITAIMGRAGTGKSRTLIERIRPLLACPEQRALVLVPDQFTLETERWLMERLGVPGLLNVQVLGLSRLAFRVREAAGGATRVPLDERGQLMALRRAADACELSAFGAAAKRPAFLRLAARSIKELKQSLADLSALPELAPDQPLLNRKLRDLSTLSDAYGRFMGARYTDYEDMLLAMLPRMERAEFLRGAHLFVDGWDRRDPLAMAVLRKLIELSRHATVTLTLDPDDPGEELFLAQRGLLAALEGIARELGRPLERVETRDLPGVISPELRFLERHLFGYRTARWEGEPRDIALYQAPTPEAEAEQVAYRLAQLARQGLRYREMAVLLGDLPGQAALYRRALARYGIPAFLDMRRSVARHPLVTCIDRALAAIEGFRTQDVLAWLKAGYGPLEPAQVEELESYALHRRLRFLRYPFSHESPAGVPLAGLEEARVRAVACLEGLRNGQRQPAVAQRCQGLAEFLLACGVPDKLRAQAAAYEAQGLPEDAMVCGQLWAVVTQMLDQMVELLGEGHCTLAEFRRLLEAGFAAADVGVLPAAEDAVLVGAVGRSRSREIRVLFIGGMNEDLVPPAPREDPLLTDRDRARMIASGLPLGEGRPEQRVQVLWDLYLAVARPERGLYVSYSLRGGAGETLFPSPLLSRLRALFPGLRVQTGAQGPALTPRSALPAIYASLGAVGETPFPPELLPALGWFARRQPAPLLRARRALAFANAGENVPPSLASALFGARMTLSITRLERYARCPFGYLIQYGLKPEYPPADPMDALTVGTFFHEVMQRYLGDVQAAGQGFGLAPEQRMAYLDRALAQVRQGIVDSPAWEDARTPYALDRLTAACRDAALRLSEHLAAGDFRPYGQELGFGPGEPLPALELPGVPASLMGRIDYVDTWRRGDVLYARTLDFKSSARALEPGRVLAGLQLQLPLYLLAVEQALHAHPAGAFYYAIDESVLEGDNPERIREKRLAACRLSGLAVAEEAVLRGMERDLAGKSSTMTQVKLDGGEAALPPELFRSLLIAALREGAGLARDMLAGRAPIRPAKDGNRPACDWCEYHSVCLFDTRFPGNRYRHVRPCKKEDLAKRLEGRDTHAPVDR